MDIQTDGDYIKRVVHGPPGDHTLKNWNNANFLLLHSDKNPLSHSNLLLKETKTANMKKTELCFHGENAVYRKTFWKPVVLPARPVPGANQQKHLSPGEELELGPGPARAVVLPLRQLARRHVDPEVLAGERFPGNLKASHTMASRSVSPKTTSANTYPWTLVIL